MTEYRGWEVISFPPPSSGGVHVVQILNMLETFDIASLDDVTRDHVMVDAMKLAFADRAYWLGDPDFVTVPGPLTGKPYARRLASQIRLDSVLNVASHGEPERTELDILRRHTTHFCTADAAGNWVACTATINTPFGAKVIIPGTGILLNNQMDDFSIKPGVPNAFGLIGAEANAIAPRKRPLSSMSPTIVLKNDRPIFALGAAGGRKIITQTVVNLVGLLDLGLPLDQALAQPRFHHQWRPDELLVEASMPERIRDGLTAIGHKLRIEEPAGISVAIAQDPETGVFTAVVDPRLQSSK